MCLPWTPRKGFSFSAFDLIMFSYFCNGGSELLKLDPPPRLDPPPMALVPLSRLDPPPRLLVPCPKPLEMPVKFPEIFY